MDNGNIGTGDAAVLALLADTNRAGNRGYWGGGEGGYGCVGPYASMATVQHSVDRNNLADVGRDVQQTILEQSQDQRNQTTLQGIANAVSQSVNANNESERRLADLLSAQQLNSLRESSDLSRQLAACCCETQKGFLQQALEQQKCCCETQKLIAEDGQKTRDLINQNTIRAAVDANNIGQTVGAINAAAAQNTAAIIAAIRDLRPHHGH